MAKLTILLTLTSIAFASAVYKLMEGAKPVYNHGTITVHVDGTPTTAYLVSHSPQNVSVSSDSTTTTLSGNT